MLLLLFFLYLIYHGPMLGDINPSERFFLTRISFVISSAQFLLFAWKIPVNPPKLMTGSVILLATSLIHSYFNFYHGYHIALSIIFLAIGFVYFGKYRLIPLAIGIGITLSSLFWAPIHSTQWVHQNWTLLNTLFILSMAYSLFLGLKMKNQMPSQFKEDPTESL